MLKLMQKQLSLEQIELEMLERAKEIWEVERDLPAVAFDPLVKMLIGACAVEIRKIMNEIHESQNRVLEKLADIMMPDVARGPIPASAIIQIQPADFFMVASPELQISCLRDDEEVVFSPTGHYNIIDAKVEKCLLLMYDEVIDITVRGLQKILKGEETVSAEVRNKRALYIGLEFNGTLDEVDNLSFFFNWAKVPMTKSETYRKLLPYVRCRIDGVDVASSSGLQSTPAERSQPARKLDIIYDEEVKLQERINDYYANHFITVSLPKNKTKFLQNKKVAPEDIETLIDLKTSRLTKPLCWIEIAFPDALPDEALQEHLSHCLLNCMPAINRKLETRRHLSYDPSTNVVSLKTNSQFLALHEVTDNAGKTYQNKMSFFDELAEEGSYYLRRGGVGRFDTRRAKELIIQLQDLLRDESSAFRGLSPNDLVSDFKTLKQIMAKIDENIGRLEMLQESPWYLVVNQNSKSDGGLYELIVKFWTTLGTKANDIPPGEINRALSIDFGPAIKSAVNITVSRGGRNHLKETHLVDAYRYELLARGRIVTVEDLKAFCSFYIGSDLDHVIVSNSVSIDLAPEKGLVRVVKVDLYPALQCALSVNEWEILLCNIEKDIQKRWMGSLPIHVSLHK